MNRIIAISLIALTGCAVGAPQYQLDAAIKKAYESAATCPVKAMPTELTMAWEKAGALGDKQCPHGTEKTPLPRSQSMEYDACMAKLIREYVKPVSNKPKRLEKLMSQTKDLAAAYRDGEIDRDEANNRSMQFWLEYSTSEISNFKLAQCQNAAFQQFVIPVYHNKGVLAGFLAKRSEIALKLDEGKLTSQQADLEAQKAFAAFASSEQNANAALQAQNAQAWQNYAVT